MVHITGIVVLSSRTHVILHVVIPTAILTSIVAISTNSAVLIMIHLATTIISYTAILSHIFINIQIPMTLLRIRIYWNLILLIMFVVSVVIIMLPVIFRPLILTLHVFFF